MFVVINPNQNKTYGSFVTWTEARIWGEDNLSHIHGWYVNQVEQVQSDCPIPQSVPSDSEGDCC